MKHPIWLLTAVAALAGAMGCGEGDPAAAPFEQAPPAETPAGEPGAPMGSLSFALTLQDGVKFDTFSYAITGPNFSKAGSIDVTSSTTVSALIDGIPAATGYSVTLLGTSTAPSKATCSGSATFDVAAGVVTEVPVGISCRLEEPAAVPVPPLAPVALGLILLAIGSVSAGRRRALEK